MKTILLSLFLLSPFLGITQSIHSSIIGSTGGNFANTDITVSWTIGELAINYLAHDNYVLAEGFQQYSYQQSPGLRISDEQDILDVSHENDSLIQLYPNPVTRELFVAINKKDMVFISSVTLVDARGNIIDRKTTGLNDPQRTYSFFMEGYPNGLYILQIKKVTGKIVTKKIIKI